MAETQSPQIVAWAIAALLVVLLLVSFSSDGTWMGGMGMGWMMGGGIVLLGLALYVAYRFGRLEQKVEDIGKPR